MNEAKTYRAGNTPAEDVSVAQLLDLAKLAHVAFQLQDGKLVMHCAKMERAFWPPVRHCLDEIGVDAIVRYFETNTPDTRATLAAAA